MASQVILPKLTYEMEDGRILEWLCDEGEAVSAGQPLLVVETDKAAVEVPAEESGTLLKILAPVDVMVTIGTPVAWIGAPGEVVPDTVSGPAAADKGPQAVAVQTLWHTVALANSFQQGRQQVCVARQSVAPLPALNTSVPAYDKGNLDTGIVQSTFS